MSAAAPPTGRRPGPPPGGMGRGGPMGGLTVPVEKSKDFSGTLKRLMRRLHPERTILVVVIAAAVVSVALSVVGPKLLGDATTLIFEGVVSQQLPAGITQDQAVELLREQGQTQQAEMVAGMTLEPGAGVDVEQLGQLLTLVTVIYLLSSLFSWVQGYLMAGVTQRTVYALRAEVERKLGRLPLTYFDTHPRGDVLSRVTNDIDNISTTLQQVLTQLITSLLTVVGVLIMMLLISPLLALISLLVVPLSFAVTLAIARRSQPHFVAQWEWTGNLNGHVEEMYTGHDVVKVYGRQQAATDEFDRLNQNMYESSYRAQFISGI
ncbi:MAG: ABC transporter ATP-binding protein, partial [Jiangellales bacterium]